MPFFGTKHVNRPLTNISVRYNFEEGIADNVFPTAPVQKESDVYYIYDESHFLLDETLRANRAESNEVGQNFSTSAYTLEEHALKELISDRDRSNADKPLNLDIDSTEHLTQKIMVRREFETAKICFTTTSWGNNATIGSTSAWNTSTSNPIADVLTATASVLLQGHIMPNAGVMGWEVLRQLKVNSTTTDRIKYTQRAIITKDIMASLFDLDELHVGKSAFNSMKEGQTASNTFLWGKHMLVYFKPGSPGLKTPSAGYMLTIGAKFRTKKWRVEKRSGDYVEVSTMFLPRVVASSAAYLLKQAVT